MASKVGHFLLLIFNVYVKLFLSSDDQNIHEKPKKDVKHIERGH